jgi:DUF4097 and DUF4098 domain-containing protein YvlB
MRNRLLGAVLLGLGIGLLINQWFPFLRWAWPLGLIAGGVLLWRELGPMAARIALIVASLTVAIFGSSWGWGFDLNPGPGREIARLESRDSEEELWEDLKRVEILNTVGDISVTGDDELDLDITYRSNRSRVKAPEQLQVSYNQGSRTLRIVGVDPKLPEDERRGLSADIALQLPEGVSVQVVNDVGDIRVEDVDDLRVETNIGDINVNRIAGSVNLRSDVGDISLDNAVEDMKVKTRIGDISIKLDGPLRAALEATNDVGDIKLNLPHDSNVTITATSSTRKLEGDLNRIKGGEGRLTLGSGEFPVKLSTNVGEVRVEQR